MATDRVDINKLDGRVYDDIIEFMKENNKETPTTVFETLDMFLSWNGIHGYTSLILRAVREIDEAVEESTVLKPVGPGRADELNEIISQGQGRVWCSDYVDGAKQLSIWTTIIADGDHYIISGGKHIGSTPKRSHHRHFYIEE